MAYDNSAASLFLASVGRQHLGGHQAIKVGAWRGRPTQAATSQFIKDSIAGNDTPTPASPP